MSFAYILRQKRDVSLKHPFWMLVSTARGARKTKFEEKFLNSKLIALPPERIVSCYAKHQQYLFEEPGELDKNFKKNKRNFIILDDLMDEASKSLKITHLFTRGHYDNLSVIFLTKNLFHKNQRTLSLNSDYMVIFKNPETFHNLLLPQDKCVRIKWSSLCRLSKTQHHLRIPNWCLIWN